MLDKHFQEKLLQLVIRDRKFLREHRHLLEASDFDANDGTAESRIKFTIATLGLNFFDSDQDCLGALLPSEIANFCKIHKAGKSQQVDLLKYAKKLLKGAPPPAKTISARIQGYKAEVIRTKIVQEMLGALQTSSLDNDTWLKLAEKGMMTTSTVRPTVSFFDNVQTRNTRRARPQNEMQPMFFIPPLDQYIAGLHRGQVGLTIAPTNRGKSLWLVWLAMAHVLQNLNVLYFTLEDRLVDVEDRFDAAFTGVPLRDLRIKPRRVASQVSRFKTMSRGSNLHIVDATDGGMTIQEVGVTCELMTRQGFQPDVVIIDYDAELSPRNKKKERFEQYDEMYTDMRQLASKLGIRIWTASQTKYGTEDKKILSVEDVEGAQWKSRKSALVIGLGRAEDEWGYDGVYLHVAKNRNGKRGVGCYVVGDRAASTFYHDDLTREFYKNNGA